MCTVTVLPVAGGFRLACNRDELRTRPPALPPETRRLGARLATFPLDPAGRGTWVAANDAGLALALLNHNPPVPRRTGARSRGLIIPWLGSGQSLEEATSLALRLDLTAYSPFRLLMLNRRRCVALTWDGVVNRVELRPLDRPLLFTSSSLGDRLVEAPRRRLFERMVVPSATPAVQDAFHRHQWPGRPHLSVNMCRGDAHTVSYTLVEASSQGMRLKYRGAAPGKAGASVIIELALGSQVAA